MWQTKHPLQTILWDELQPYEGRLGQTVRMTVLVMITVAVSMALQVPEAAISCYLIFFAARDNAGSAIQIGLALVVAASLGILLAFVFLMLSADEPGLRLAFIALFTFAGMFFSQASKLGPIAATLGFVFSFALTLYDEIPIPELLTRGLAWIWVAIFFPMFFMVVLNILAGPNPARLLRNELAERLATAEGLITGKTAAEADAKRLLARGNEPLRGWLKSARFLAKMNAKELARSEGLINASYALLSLADAAKALSLRWDHDELDDLTGRMTALRDALRGGKVLTVSEPRLRPRAAGKREFESALRQLENTFSPDHTVDGGVTEDAKKEPFLAPDAFTNPDYTRFALKVLLAVMVCYITYTGLHWFDIHTAMVTGYYVALGTTGETVHKMTLRITGALIGAVMGIGSVLFVMPLIDDIGQLLLLVGTGTFISAWVANGSRRIQYIGWQMALCFFLVVLHGYGPSYDLGAASSRVIGILFGNAVMGIVFIYIWPVSISGSISSTLSDVLSTLSRFLSPKSASPIPQRPFYPKLEAAERSLELGIFEMQRSAEEQKQVERNQEVSEAIDALAPPILLLSEIVHGKSPTQNLIPLPIRASFARFQASASAFLHDCSVAVNDENSPVKEIVWKSAFPALQTSVLQERLRHFNTNGPLLSATNRELQAHLRLCRQIDKRLSDLAVVWS